MTAKIQVRRVQSAAEDSSTLFFAVAFQKRPIYGMNITEQGCAKAHDTFFYPATLFLSERMHGWS